jgi:hypothetical protein
VLTKLAGRGLFHVNADQLKGFASVQSVQCLNNLISVQNPEKPVYRVLAMMRFRVDVVAKDISRIV